MRQPDLFGGDSGRDEGIRRVKQHTPPEWGEAYRKHVMAWFDRLPEGRCFRGENFRMELIFNHALPQPHHPNVWGAHARSLINTLLQQNRIRTVGLSKALFTKSHSHQYALYEKLR